MPPIFLTMIGGAVGAGARYVATGLSARVLGTAFPWGTLGINIFGGLLMGILAGVLARGEATEAWRLFIGVGVLGGFTTFSAFSLDSVQMFARGDLIPAVGYIAASVIGAIAATAIGLTLVRAL